MQLVNGLSIELVPHAEVERQVVANLPVILEIVKLVGLGVVNGVLSHCKRKGIGRVVYHPRRATEVENAHSRWQERHRVVDPPNVSAHLQLMAANRFRKVIRKLEVLNRAALRKVRCSTDGLQRKPTLASEATEADDRVGLQELRC